MAQASENQPTGYILYRIIYNMYDVYWGVPKIGLPLNHPLTWDFLFPSSYWGAASQATPPELFGAKVGRAEKPPNGTEVGFLA